MSRSSYPFGPAPRAPRGGLTARAERILGGDGVFADFHDEFRPRVVKSWKVVEALVLREAVTRYGRRSASFVWAVLDPMLQLLMMMLIFTWLGRQAAAGDYLSVFFITGIMPVFAWRNAAVQGAGAITGNRGMLRYPQVRPFHIVVARTLLEMAISGLVLILFVIGLKTFFDVPFAAWLDEPLKSLQAIGCLVLLCYGSAVLSSQIGRVFELWGRIMSLMGRILFFTSGIWYTMASLPEGPRRFMIYNPLAHNIEWVRDGVIRGFDSTLYNPAYPLWVGLGFLAIGLFMEWLIGISSHVDD